MGAAQGPGIVVGVDGSPAAHAAVAWAATHARQLGRELVLLHAHEAGRPTPFPAMPARDEGGEQLPYADELGDLDTLRVRRKMVAGAPARVLVAASEDAVMLVLGRPRGLVSSWPGPMSLTRRVLGSSTCPVVLVPERLGASS